MQAVCSRIAYSLALGSVATACIAIVVSRYIFASRYLAMIERRGGIVEREPVCPQLIYQIFGDRILSPAERIVGISFSIRAIDDSVATLIGYSTGVRELELSGAELSDEGVHAALTQRSLQSLFIARAGISDMSIERVCRRRSITTLSLVFCDRLTNSSVDRIATMAQLDSLSLRGCDGIDGSAFGKLKELTALTKLDLAYSNIDDEDVEFIAAMPLLRSVDLSYTSVSTEAIDNLRRRTRCQIVVTAD